MLLYSINILKVSVKLFVYRELLGVNICTDKGLDVLQDITKKVMDSEVCELPCSLQYLELTHLPGINLAQ